MWLAGKAFLAFLRLKQHGQVFGVAFPLALLRPFKSGPFSQDRGRKVQEPLNSCWFNVKAIPSPADTALLSGVVFHHRSCNPEESSIVSEGI